MRALPAIGNAALLGLSVAMGGAAAAAKIPTSDQLFDKKEFRSLASFSAHQATQQFAIHPDTQFMGGGKNIEEKQLNALEKIVKNTGGDNLPRFV